MSVPGEGFPICSGASVFAPPEAPEPVLFAADQLAYYLAVITGGRFPVVDDPASAGIHLDGADPDLRPGAYRIAVTADAVRIAAPAPGALLHGVYHFLETHCGCRWLSAFEGGEVVPRLPRLVVPTGEATHRPAMDHRAFTNFSDIDERTVEMVDWMCKNRFNRFMIFANMEGSFERYRDVLKEHLLLRDMRVEIGHHSFKYWLPPAEHFAQHPEWFALIDGERSSEGQLCTANPEVARRVADRINEFLDANPEIDVVGLWPNDGYGWCECDACRALEPQRHSALYPTQPARSETYIQFVNQVAAAVCVVHPDRRISALAYVNYVEPPTTPPLPNVDVCFAAMHRCFKHPFQGAPGCTRNNAQYAEYFGRWREAVPGNLYLFCYLMLIDTCSVPFRITRMLGPNFQWLAEHGCDGFVMEFKPEEWGVFGVNGHLIGRLAWDPELDIPAWLTDHYQDLYGPAAEEMAGFWDAILDRFVDPGPCVYHYDLTYTCRATRELLRPALEHLGRARVAASRGEACHIEAVDRASVSADLLLRMGQWQRALREARGAEGLKRQVLVPRAKEAGEALVEWAESRADSGALFAPRIKLMVERHLAGLT